MGAFESMDAKVRQIGQLSTESYNEFFHKYCQCGKGYCCSLSDLSIAFSLFLIGNPKTRLHIAPFFEEPRKGRYNIRVWSHYSRKVLPRILKDCGFICIGNDSDAVVLGLSLTKWPTPIQSVDSHYNVALLQQQRQGAKNNSMSDGSSLSTTPQYS